MEKRLFEYSEVSQTDLEFIKSVDPEVLKSAGVDIEEYKNDIVKALQKQGLVQKEVTVQGRNGTFTRKQWVRASDAKGTSEKPKGKGGNSFTVDGVDHNTNEGFGYAMEEVRNKLNFDSHEVTDIKGADGKAVYEVNLIDKNDKLIGTATLNFDEKTKDAKITINKKGSKPPKKRE